MANAIKKVW